MTPRWAHEWPALAMVAEDLRARRAADYPRLIAAGKLDPAAAARALAIITAIAQDWSALLPLPPGEREGAAQRREGEGTPPADSLMPAIPPSAHPEQGLSPPKPASKDRIAELTAAVARLTRRTDKAREAVPADLIAAALWQPGPDLAIAAAIDDSIRAGLCGEPEDERAKAVARWRYALEYAELAATLLWWEERHPHGPRHLLAVNRAIRDRAPRRRTGPRQSEAA